ncbi:MAG TPA: hypothetical protein VH370_26410 [Humisphaera sp.]|nr:hypothetical protein [Humisphaera sp.]
MTAPFHLTAGGPLPHDLVVPMTDVGAFLALVTIMVGFAYLFFGLQVFRLITTVEAIFAGIIVGAFFGLLIESPPIGMLIGGLAAGLATWFYTRWTVALVVGLLAAIEGGMIAVAHGANGIGAFFVALASAVAIGAPVLMFYRTIIMLYTSFSGGAMVVSGTAAAIVLIRFHAMPTVPQETGHKIVGLICTLLLAIPAFYFQRLRYKDVPAALSVEEPVAAPAVKRKAA